MRAGVSRALTPTIIPCWTVIRQHIRETVTQRHAISTSASHSNMEPPSKKRRLSDGDSRPEGSSTLPISLNHPVSPPRTKRSRSQAAPADATALPVPVPSFSEAARHSGTKVFKSPIQLTWIRDLPDAANTDAVKLRDILGDPLIAECWNFNYLHDINFLKAAFDEDVRDTVQIHIVHGFWKKEDAHRLMLLEEAEAHKNVKLHCAFMPTPFGTHHSKMLILLRHDNIAQVVIHTANMISRDWTNMTQAVWRSPLLPLQQTTSQSPSEKSRGTGEKFKVDLCNYLRAYNRKGDLCRSLVEKLGKYDFSNVKAALVASVPGRHNIHDQTEETKWGWAGLKHALRTVPVQDGKSEIVVQISSIATLGAADKWLRNSLFTSLATSKNKATTAPKFKVVFPTADEIRRSLDGYDSGDSIHTRIQSSQQAKQLLYLKPMFHHWANDAEQGKAIEGETQEAGRKRAAPHIKTYVRYGERSIDWALTTSANLSKQAWGEALNEKTGEMSIASWEIGVLVWPSLFAKDAKMMGTFRKDTPDNQGETAVVGMRIPYDLPLQPYGANEKPWVATMSHHEPDWKGEVWEA